MSHVDEGTLHAYLDGELEIVQPGASAALEAHVAVCGECRARLDDERRIRDRAQAVLGHAAPARLEVPPFDAVVRRARGSAAGGAGPASPRRRSFTLPLAWAASIALALAGGWWAREMAFGPENAALREITDLDAVTGTAPVPASVTATAQAGSAASPATPEDASAKPSVATQAGPAAARESRPAVQAGPAQPVEITAPATVQHRVIAGREAREARARASAFAPPPAADSGGVVVVAESNLSPPAVQMAPVVLAPAPGAAQWTAVDRAEAERRLGGSLLIVEGLEIRSIEVADTGGFPLVRTRQAVAPGVVLVLLQHTATREVPGEPVADAARASPPARGERTGEAEPASAELVVERGGFLVRLSADLPQDSLRALAGRLR